MQSRWHCALVSRRRADRLGWAPTGTRSDRDSLSHPPHRVHGVSEALVSTEPVAGRPVESFDLAEGSMVRSVLTRAGEVRRSLVPASGPQGGDLSARFDLAWLQGRELSHPAHPRDEIRVVDLFAGCGGLSLGIAEACRALEFEMAPVWAVDIDARALATYAFNFPGAECSVAPVEEFIDGGIGDLPTLTERSLRKRLGRVDMVIAGPPCQGHSDLNNHTRRVDPRNELYLRVARFCEVVRPSHVVIENVPGVLRDRSQASQRTWAVLEALGYSISTGTINAADVGVAQRRKRNLTIASLAVTPNIADAVAAVATQHRPVLWAVQDILGQYDPVSVFDSAPVPAGETKDRIDYLFDNDLFDLPDSERPPCHRLKAHTYRSIYGRMHLDRPAQTITTGFGVMGKGRFVHPTERRTVTPHEAARIQFFPDFFAFENDNRAQLQRQIGNAVPPKLGYAIGLHLLR
jgi:DNA (cytosine-5)-methyltransferase 1